MALCLLLASAKVEAAEPTGTPAVETDPKEGTWPEAIGPFAIESRDGQSRLQIGFAGQLLYQMDGRDTGGAERTLRHSVDVRRLRETLKGSAASERFTFALQLSTLYGALELIDLYLNYAFLPDIQIRLGQMKVPFTRYRMMSFSRLTFVDWALVKSYFGAERQRGVVLHNGLTKQRRIAYALGLFTGQNARAAAAVGLARATGEPVENPSDLVDPAAMERIHPEIALHLSYNHNDIDTAIDTDLEGGPLRFSVGVSGAYDTRPDPLVDFSFRLAPEVLFKAYGFSFFSAFYSGFADRGGVGLDQQHAMSGLLVQLSYLLWGRLEISARFAFVDLDDDVLRQSRNRADDRMTVLQGELDALRAREWDSGLEAAIADRETALSDLGKRGTLNRDQELTFGLNVFIIGTSLRWQSDVSWLQREYVDGNRDDIRLRSQITLQF